MLNVYPFHLLHICFACGFFFVSLRSTFTFPFTSDGQPQMTSRTHFKRKEVDDVMGGEAAWENVDKAPGAFFLSFSFIALFPLLCPRSLHFAFPSVHWWMGADIILNSRLSEMRLRRSILPTTTDQEVRPFSYLFFGTCSVLTCGC
jgi:hypothetical protein